MRAEYVGLLLIFSSGLALVGLLLATHALRGVTRLGGEREPEDPLDEWERIAVHRREAFPFYVSAIVILVFCAETTFFFAFGAVFEVLGGYGLFALGIFCLPLLVGLLYGWRKGGFEW